MPQNEKHKRPQRIKSVWQSAWPKALSLWNSYIKLREPRWCFSDRAAKEEGLEGSFAMIRLTDHLIVINLHDVARYQVEPYALQILAHEIGHHVMVPANLQDSAQLFARIRWGLAGIEDRTPFVANLYADQLINHFLHQDREIDMASVFRTLGPGIKPSPVWLFTLRMYEHLWGLDRKDLTGKHPISEEMDGDAALGASLIRSYSRKWLEGAGRYTALLYPYLCENRDFISGKKSFKVFDDASQCGSGSAGILGLAEVDDQEQQGQIDPRLEALGAMDQKNAEVNATFPDTAPPLVEGGQEIRQRYRDPGVYVDLMRQINPNMDENDVIIGYYKELALPHLVPFPVEMKHPLSDQLPEGTDTWETGDTPDELDFLESVLASPVIIPGYTTRKRLYGASDDPSEDPNPLNLYIGIDCSGSMVNPAQAISWPVLAGAVIGLSALRAGASVKAVLSGEPGSYMETPGFVETEAEVLKVLTAYLGTGYAFGIPRLKDTFDHECPQKTHIMIITDDDIFAMLGATGPDNSNGWAIAQQALDYAQGGGTIVLHSRPEYRKQEAAHLKTQGWHIHYVTDEKELLDFAALFAARHYAGQEKR